MSANPKKVVLAYSGGLDTSIILKWLIDTYGCEVVAFCADLGQADEIATINERGLATGASTVIVDDLREEFVRDFVFPMMRANAVYEAGYLLGTSIARPLIAKRQIEVAREHGADAVAHGATGKGNDQVRFELTYYALEPGIRVIAPWRIWDLEGREAMIDYAARHEIPVPVTKEKPYSSDRNLLHISFESGILEDPWLEPYADMFVLTTDPTKAPDQPEYIEVDYEKGDPVAVNGERLGPAAMLARLNEIGGRHGVGRLDLVENRYVGMKSRGVYETPGGTIMLAAHRAVESLTLDREVMHLRDSLVPRYAEMVYYGYWFTPERRMLQTMIDESQQNVTGTARLKLYKGSVTVAGRKAARSLYDPSIASFEAAGGYNQADAEGFIKLSALRLRIQAAVAKRAAKQS
jgi:argininosuccinate synthase